VKQQQFEYTYLFGSVGPSKGIGEAIVVPWVSKDIMIEHLKQYRQSQKRDVTPSLLWMEQDGIQKTLPMTLRMSVSSNFHPILQSETLSNKYGVG
jgi:hypothetical protein